MKKVKESGRIGQPTRTNCDGCGAHAHEHTRTGGEGSNGSHAHEHTHSGERSNPHDHVEAACGCCAQGGASCGCGSGRPRGGWWAKRGKWVILGISLAALIVSFIAPFKDHAVMKYLDFGWIAVLLCAPPIFAAAFGGLKQGRVTSSLLIAMSILACITLEILMISGVLGGDGHGHSNIFAAGEVAWLMAIGEWLEDVTVRKARSGVSDLVNLTPAAAKYRVDGKLVEKPLADVRVNDVVTVLPGDLISVDGVIVSGGSGVNEAVITGESVPVDKRAGDNVYGGTLNGEGALEVRVTRPANEMAVAKLRALVEEAEGKKAPIAKLADRWAGYIVPAALVLSVVIFLLTFFALAKGNWGESVERAVTMLVVFCPCALALATPTAVAAGLGNASKKGILIKSGGAIETLARIDTMAFDKTGTLTTGKLSVADMKVYGVETAHAAAVAGACEGLSGHPIAKAIADYCRTIAAPYEAAETRALTGSGVTAVVGGKPCAVVKWDGLDERGVDGRIAAADAAALLSDGRTVSAVVEDGRLIALIALFDTIKPGAAGVCAELEGMGVRTVMLTGDNGGVAKSAAKALGLSDYRHSLLPEQKLTEIESMKAAGRRVCMVGDGVNDAPALALADTSVAMGALGSDAAVETAETALMSDELSKLPLLVRLSRRVFATIKINIALSMSINLLSVVLSLLGVLDPITGALVHNVSSVLVVGNSALLLRYAAKRKK